MFPRLVIATCLAILIGSVDTVRADPKRTYTVEKPMPATVHVLRSRDTGIFEEIRVKINDRVSAGDIVAALDHYRQEHAFLTAKRRAENFTALEIADAEHNEKKSAFSEAETQHRRKKISDLEFERARTSLRVARARLDAAKEALEQAKLDLELARRTFEDRFTRSPVPATVMVIHKSLGERVQPGDALVTVGDFSELTAELTLGREAASKLVEGGQLAIRTAQNGPVLQAVVQSILPAAKSTSGEKVVKILFPNPEAPATGTLPLLPESPHPAITPAITPAGAGAK